MQSSELLPFQTHTQSQQDPEQSMQLVNDEPQPLQSLKQRLQHPTCRLAHAAAPRAALPTPSRASAAAAPPRAARPIRPRLETPGWFR